MNASVLKALGLLQERAGSAPWTTTHADAASACGLQERTWRRAVSLLEAAGRVGVHRTRHAVSLTFQNGHPERTPRTDKNGQERTFQNGQRTPKTDTHPRAVSPDVELLLSLEKQTTTATTTAVEQTARDQNGHSRTDNGHPERTFQNGQERTLSPGLAAEVRDLYLLALDRAEECGRLRAENASLRAALAARQEVSPCPSPAPPLPRSTPALPAATPGSATASPASAPTVSAARSPETSSGPTSTRTVTGTPPANGPRPSAPPSPRAAEPGPLHPANNRAPLQVGPEPEDPDRSEDVARFRELVATPHASELEVEAQVARALSYGVRLHQAVASVALAEASGSPLKSPVAFAWAVISGKSLPTPGSSKTWAELRATVLPAVKAEAARKAVPLVAGNHKVEHVSRPLARNPVQQRQEEVRARQAARYLEQTRRALAASGGQPT